MELRKLLLLMAVSGVIWGAGEENPCFKCHRGAADHHGRGLHLNVEDFEASTHASLGCAGCHMDGFDAYPHKGKKADAADCKTCHSGDASGTYNRAQIETDVKESIHAKNVDPDFACTNCHNPHDFRPVAKMSGVQEAIEIGNHTCMECHTAPDPKGGLTAKAAFQKLSEKHVWIPMWELHVKAARCVDCHTAGNQASIHKILPAAQAQRDCVACHSQNSVLMRKLYRHSAKEERTKGGLVNAVMFNNAYMIGATKSAWLDTGSLVLFGVAMGGIVLHGFGRWRVGKKGGK